MYTEFIEKCHNKFARELRKDIGIEFHALSKIDDDECIYLYEMEKNGNGKEHVTQDCKKRVMNCKCSCRYQ